MRHKYPKYSHGFLYHHGKSPFYLRAPGRKRVPLPGLPWSPEFMEARQRALEGDWLVPELGASRTKAGTVIDHCISLDMLTSDPLTGVKLVAIKSDGHRPWERTTRRIISADRPASRS
jgi:hypothetical protein